MTEHETSVDGRLAVTRRRPVGVVLLTGLAVVATVPYGIWLIDWWSDNYLGLVAFSVAMPMAAAAACLARYRLGTTGPSHGRARRLHTLIALGALACGLAGWRLGEPILGSTGIWLAALSVIGLLGPTQRLGAYALPLFPLVLSAPLTWGLPGRLETVLRHATAALAQAWLTLGGTTVRREGVVLFTPAFWNRVDDACSGVATFSALLVLALLLGVVLRVGDRVTALVGLLTLPLGLVLNGARVAWISALGERGGVVLATGRWHDLTGWITFGIGYAVLLVALVALARRRRRGGHSGGRSASTTTNATEMGPTR